MIKIVKKQNENGYIFTIGTEQGKFEISFEGNLDLYWRYIHCSNSLEVPDYKTFIINKENYYLYTLFEILYDDIKNCNVYQMDESDFLFCDSIDEIEEEKNRIKSLNNDLRRYQKYHPEKLFEDNSIKWHSDDSSYEEASVLKIEKQENIFLLTIEKSKGNPLYAYATYSVRISNIGSRHDPFNYLFMQMYNRLKEYEPDYHQIHIEEYLYQKKLEKKF